MSLLCVRPQNKSNRWLHDSQIEPFRKLISTQWAAQLTRHLLQFGRIIEHVLFIDTLTSKPSFKNPKCRTQKMLPQTKLSTYKSKNVPSNSMFRKVWKLLTFVWFGHRFVHVVGESRAVFEGHVDPLSDGPRSPQLPDDAVEYRLHVAVEAPQSRRHIAETHKNTSLVGDSRKMGVA